MVKHVHVFGSLLTYHLCLGLFLVVVGTLLILVFNYLIS